MELRVSWHIDVDADSPEEAAKLAREIQLDPNSLATYFTVTSEEDATKEVNLAHMPEKAQPVFVTVPLEDGLVGDVRVYASEASAKKREKEWSRDHDINNYNERSYQGDWGTSIGTLECDLMP